MEVISIKISDIKITDRFRKDKGDLADLVESIKTKGFLIPVIVDSKKKLIAGERRVTAAKEAGLKEISAVVHKSADDVDSLEIELIENVVRKDFHWTERAELEQAIMQRKKKSDPEWTIEDQSEFMKQSVGATHRRLALAAVMDAVPELSEASTEDEAWKKYKKLEEEVVLASMRDNAPNYEEAIKHASNHYKVGNALEGLKKVNPGVISFCEVDPPYAVQLNKAKSRLVDLKKMDRYNEVDEREYPKFVHQVGSEVFRILRDDSFCVWWLASRWYQPVYNTYKIGFKVSEIPAIWVKTSLAGQTASPDTMLGSAYEGFLVCRKGKPKLAKAGRQNTFIFDPVPPQSKIHPTERPLPLMQEILATFSRPGEIICVPFLGSGVTLRAAYLANCTGFGWDLDEMCKERFLNAVYRDQESKAKE